MCSLKKYDACRNKTLANKDPGAAHDAGFETVIQIDTSPGSLSRGSRSGRLYISVRMVPYIAWQVLAPVAACM